MTLAEKAAQLGTSNASAIPRLGVQENTYWSEAQHGVSACRPCAVDARPRGV